MNHKEINKRYTVLSESSCCLSCGGALNYADIQQGEICVDLGSGRGTDVIRMAEKTGKTGYVYGFDISEGMINKAVGSAMKLGIQNAEFILCPLEKLALQNNVADVIISNCTINHSSDKQSVWNEIYRILKKGGRFIVSDIYSTTTVPELYRNDPVAIAECWAGSVTKGEYLEHVKNAGFSEINILEESRPYEKGKILVISWTISGIK